MCRLYSKEAWNANVYYTGKKELECATQCTPYEEEEIDFNNFLTFQDSSSIKYSAPTVLIVDGFLSNRTSPMSVSLKNAYARARDMNVFVLDWGRLSGGEITLGNTIRTMSAYRAVLSNVAPVGRRVAEFLSFLRDSKHINFYDMTIVGESLGAHVAANAAQAVKIVSGEKIGRVVGLDPAGPFTQNIKTLHKQDANFVDIYHTNRGLLGTTSDAGHVNVYVNGGTSQPGCLQADFTGLM
ncbi:Phospholipase A1, partial [Orchesella cincta]